MVDKIIHVPDNVLRRTQSACLHSCVLMSRNAQTKEISFSLKNLEDRISGNISHKKR